MKTLLYILLLIALGLLCTAILFFGLNHLYPTSIEEWHQSLFVERSISSWLEIAVVVLVPVITSLVIGLKMPGWHVVLLIPIAGTILGFIGVFVLGILYGIYMFFVSGRFIVCAIAVAVILTPTTTVIRVIVE